MEKKYCLCCGKEIEDGLWHKSCIKHFFGTNTIPEISFNNEQLKALALAQLNNKSTIAGVQEKLSLHLNLDIKKRPRLTIIGFPTGYILKPQSSTYKQLPEFEHTAMLLAEACDIKVVPHGLVKTDSNEFAYITKRIDRDGDLKIHLEDFCQASNLTTSNKYRSSYEECMKLIENNSSTVVFDKTRFFACIYFCFIIGNSDAHLKNFSFIMNDDGSLSLADFYDLLPTRVILPTDPEELGMRFNGRKNNIRKHDFDEFASSCGINYSAEESIIKDINSRQDRMVELINQSLLSQNAKVSWIRLIKKNIKRIQRAD